MLPRCLPHYLQHPPFICSLRTRNKISPSAPGSSAPLTSAQSAAASAARLHPHLQTLNHTLTSATLINGLLTIARLYLCCVFIQIDCCLHTDKGRDAALNRVFILQCIHTHTHTHTRLLSHAHTHTHHHKYHHIPDISQNHTHTHTHTHAITFLLPKEGRVVLFYFYSVYEMSTTLVYR